MIFYLALYIILCLSPFFSLYLSLFLSLALSISRPVRRSPRSAGQAEEGAVEEGTSSYAARGLWGKAIRGSTVGFSKICPPDETVLYRKCVE